MLSYWEQQSLLEYDYIIVGAGITGLSTAIELREQHPKASVLVLERGIFSAGASTRNAGFACMGSLSELLDDLNVMTEAEVLALFERRKKGLEILRNRLGDDKIGYKAEGSHDLITKDEIDILERIPYANELLKSISGKDAYKIASDKIGDFGFDKNQIAALIENTCEGQLHTGKMMRSLTELAISKGVEIKTGVQVSHFEEEQNSVIVSTSNSDHQQIAFHARQLFICTNAFTPTLLPNIDLQPGRGQVLITKPIPGLRLKGIFHFDKGYYYFREIDGRVLFGGGRNLDFAGETTTEIALNNAIQQDLEQKLKELILPGTPFEINMKWAGIMAFGQDKNPIVQRISARVAGAFRMGGMGVALGSQVAKELVAL